VAHPNFQFFAHSIRDEFLYNKKTTKHAKDFEALLESGLKPYPLQERIYAALKEALSNGEGLIGEALKPFMPEFSLFTDPGFTLFHTNSLPKVMHLINDNTHTRKLFDVR